jgi:hypothetical protein
MPNRLLPFVTIPALVVVLLDAASGDPKLADVVKLTDGCVALPETDDP